MTSEEFHDALYRERCRREDVENDNRRRRAAILAQRRHFNDWQWSLIESALLTPNVELTGAAAGLSPQRPATEGSEVERRVRALVILGEEHASRRS